MFLCVGIGDIFFNFGGICYVLLVLVRNCDVIYVVFVNWYIFVSIIYFNYGKCYMVYIYIYIMYILIVDS